MSVSVAVTAGINATAAQYNDLRTDAITQFRRFFFEIKGSLVVGDGQSVIPVPANMTVTKIKHKVTVGSATIRVVADANTIKASMAVGTSYANETTGFTNTSLLEGVELKVDVQAVSSAENLRVLVYATEII